MAMAALSCTGLPTLASSHIECSSSASRDLKQSTGVSRAAMEPCVGCRQGIRSTLCSPVSWTPLGLGRKLGLNDMNCRRLRGDKEEEKSRRGVEIVQRVTVRVFERNPKPCAVRSWRSRSAFAIVQAALTPEQLEGGSRLTSVKDYNSALLSCVRYAIFCHFGIYDEDVSRVRLCASFE